MIQASGTLLDFSKQSSFVTVPSLLPTIPFLSTSHEQTETFKIDRMMKRNRMIYRLKSVFPFDFFPDQLVIDETKISIYSRNFFFSNDICCILYKDIQYVEVISSVIFASIVFKLIGLPHDYIQIKFLKKNEAYKARRIIQGFIESTKEQVDFSQYSIAEVIDHTQKLGSAHGSELTRKIH